MYTPPRKTPPSLPSLPGRHPPSGQTSPRQIAPPWADPQADPPPRDGHCSGRILLECCFISQAVVLWFLTVAFTLSIFGNTLNYLRHLYVLNIDVKIKQTTMKKNMLTMYLFDQISFQHFNICLTIFCSLNVFPLCFGPNLLFLAFMDICHFVICKWVPLSDGLLWFCK